MLMLTKDKENMKIQDYSELKNKNDFISWNREQANSFCQDFNFFGDLDNKLKQVSMSRGTRVFSGVFVCVDCGEMLPVPVISFFNFNITKVKCYKCQGFV